MEGDEVLRDRLVKANDIFGPLNMKINEEGRFKNLRTEQSPSTHLDVNFSLMVVVVEGEVVGGGAQASWPKAGLGCPRRA